MNVLMAGKGSPPAGTFQNILSYMNAAANVATGAGKAAEGFAA
jgi:hypothetical protein